MSGPQDDDRVNVLLVDDHRENLVALTGILAQPGYNLVTAQSGAEALVRLLHDEYAVIVLDVFMPEIDGFEVAEMVRQRQRTRQVPIIFLTAAGKESRFSQKGYAVGAVDYLTKPADPEVVRAKVAVFVDLYRARRQVARQAALLRESERRERERQFRLLFDGANDAVLIVADDARVVEANHAACALFGLARDALVGRRLEEFARGDSGDGVAAQWRVLLERGEFAGEFGIVRSDGTPRDVDYRATAHFVPGRHLAILRDVTERRRGEHAQRFLADASAVLGASLEGTPTLERVARLAVGSMADWCVIDARGDDGAFHPVAVAHADPAKLPLLRALLAREGAVGFPRVVDEVARSGRPMLLSEDVAAALHPGPRDVERARLVHQLAPRSAVVAPLRVRDQTLGALTLVGAESDRRYDAVDVRVAEDLASRVAYALENARLYHEAREAVRARDEFLSIASHELRTPLTSLQLQVQSVARSARRGPADQGLPSAVGEKFDTIERSVGRLTKLIDDLLDVARLANHRVELHVEDVDLAAVARDVAARFAEDLQRAACPLVLRADVAAVGRWDRTRLEEVVTNLLSNAIKYGAGKPIELSVESAGGTARLVVRDHGIGIAPEDQARIFDRFERAVSVRQYGGLGLGLWIVRQFLEAMGGRIEVASTPGDGSAFTVELPTENRGDDAAPREDAAPAATPASTAS